MQTFPAFGIGNILENSNTLEDLKNKTLGGFEREKLYRLRNYESLPVAFSKGQGIYIWDADGKKYYDFHAAYSVVHQGLCHPNRIESSTKQVEVLTSDGFYPDDLGYYAQHITQVFGYDKVLLIQCEVEAIETACKLARKWGYVKKKIPENEAKILLTEENGLAAATSSNACYREHYGTSMSEFLVIPYDDLFALENILKEEPNICAFLVESIKDEAGIIVPSPGYLKRVRELCTKYNVLWIDDEVQTDLGRTGKLLVVDHENVKPDIVCLGEALPGSMMAIPAVLVNDSVILCTKPTEYGYVYGGSSIQCRVAAASLKFVTEGKLIKNAEILGNDLKKKLEKLPKNIVEEIRGKGLLYGIVIKKDLGFNATDVCTRLCKKGLLAKSIHDDILRLSSSLFITKVQMKKCIKIIFKTCNSLYT